MRRDIRVFVLFLVCLLFVVFLLKRKLSPAPPKGTLKMNYDEYKEICRAGDLILNNNQNIVTTTFGGSFWNHVAIVYVDPDSGVKYAWEICNPAGALAFINARGKSGTRLTPLRRYVERSKGPVAIRLLTGPPVDQTHFRDLVREKWNIPFAYDFVAQGINRFFEGFFVIPIETRTVDSPRYCAELCAETYTSLGVFQNDGDIQPRTVVPRDFAADTEHLPLSRDYTFSHEIILK